MLPLQAHAVAVRELWETFKSGYNPAKPDHKLPVHQSPASTIRAIFCIRPIRTGATL